MPSNWKKALCHKYDINQKMRCHREPHGRHQRGWKEIHYTLKNHWWNITRNCNELKQNVQLPAKLRLTKTSETMNVPIYNSFIGERGGGWLSTAKALSLVSAISCHCFVLCSFMNYHQDCVLWIFSRLCICIREEIENTMFILCLY